jgi:Acetyltransferase (GNAT) domain
VFTRLERRGRPLAACGTELRATQSMRGCVREVGNGHLTLSELRSSANACVLDPIAHPGWATLVERAPAANAFHHPLWLALVRDCYRYPLSAVGIEDDDGVLVAGLPLATVASRITGNRLVSIPFSDMSPPLALSPADEDRLLTAVDAERRRLGLRLEVHADVPSLPDAAVSESFYHHVIPIQDEAEVMIRSRVRETKRRCAARARRMGVTVARRIDRAAIDAYFRLHVITRRRLGVPTQPLRWFHGLQPLFEAGLGFVLLAEWDRRPIAAAVYLHHRSTLTYKYGASDPAHLDKRPNDLVQLEALRIASELGCTQLDLGRTELDNQGLRRFKRDLGAQERVLGYTTSPPRAGERTVRSITGIQRTMIRRLPTGFGRLLGAAIYRHFG